MSNIIREITDEVSDSGDTILCAIVYRYNCRREVISKHILKIGYSKKQLLERKRGLDIEYELGMNEVGGTIRLSSGKRMERVDDNTEQSYSEYREVVDYRPLIPEELK